MLHDHAIVSCEPITPAGRRRISGAACLREERRSVAAPSSSRVATALWIGARGARCQCYLTTPDRSPPRAARLDSARQGAPPRSTGGDGGPPVLPPPSWERGVYTQRGADRIIRRSEEARGRTSPLARRTEDAVAPRRAEPVAKPAFRGFVGGSQCTSGRISLPRRAWCSSPVRPLSRQSARPWRAPRASRGASRSPARRLR